MITLKARSHLQHSILLTFFIFISSLSFSQKESPSADNANKYRLDLPQEWQKPKLISAITEILSQTVNELKGKDYCTDCITNLIVQPVIESVQIYAPLSSPSIGDSYTDTYPCSFWGGLRVYDSTGKVIAQLVLVKPTEKFDYRKKVDMTGQNNTMFEDRTIYDSSGKAAIGTIRVRVADPVMKDFQRENIAANPPLDFLMDICEKKIYDTKKMLKKLADKQ